MTTRNPTSLLVALAFATAVLMHGGVAAAAPLDLCIDKASPSAAMDRQLAAAIAAAQGRSARIHDYDGTGGERGYRLRNYNELLTDQCQLVLGFPFDGTAADLPQGIRATASYARTGFVLVSLRQASYRTLDALPAQSAVAVTYNTAPNLWFERYPGLVRRIYEFDGGAIDAVLDGGARAAMIWRPSAVAHLQSLKALDKVRLDALAEPYSQVHLVALAASDATATVIAFDNAITTLQNNGTLARILGQAADLPAAGVAGSGVKAAAVVHGPTTPIQACASANPAKARKSKAPPPLFTDAQALQGKKAYDEKCSYCHAPDLNGRAGPALKGKFFAAPSHDYKVGDIFTIVAENMPATSPASLTREQYAEIMAYILQQNGYPAGDKTLEYDIAKASKVPLRYYGQ